MTVYFSSKSGGPCWSRDLGYHTPKPLPFSTRLALYSAPKKKPKPTKAKP